MHIWLRLIKSLKGNSNIPQESEIRKTNNIKNNNLSPRNLLQMNSKHFLKPQNTEFNINESYFLKIELLIRLFCSFVALLLYQLINKKDQNLLKF